jgi:hypothetical protein
MCIGRALEGPVFRYMTYNNVNHVSFADKVTLSFMSIG